MFPRIKSYRNKDGSWRHYLYLVATKRIGGRDNLYACSEQRAVFEQSVGGYQEDTRLLSSLSDTQEKVVLRL